MSKPTPPLPPLQPIIKDRSLLAIDTRISPLPSPSTHFEATSTTKDQQPSYFSPITPSYTPISHGILLKNSILLSNNNNNTAGLGDKNPSFNLLPGSTTVLGGIGAALNRSQSPEGKGGNTTSGSDFNSETTDSSTTSSSTSSAFGSPVLKPTKSQSPSDSLATLTLASAPNSPGASTILNNSGTITPGGTTGVKHCTFAPLPKVDPIARRNSVALGVAARTKVLNSLDTDPTVPFVLDDAATPNSSTSTTTPSASSTNNSITSSQIQPSPNRSRSHSPSPTSSRRSSGAALHARPTGSLSPPLSSQELNVAGLAGILNSGIGHGFPLSPPVHSHSHGGIDSRNGSNNRSGSTSPTISRRNSIETGLSLHYIQAGIAGSRSTSANMSGSGFLSNPHVGSGTSALFTSSDKKGKERESSREREVLGFDPIRAREGIAWREEHGGYVGNTIAGGGVQKDHISGGDEEKEILAHVDSKGSKLVIELPPHIGSEDEGNDDEEVDDDEDEDEEEEEEDDDNEDEDEEEEEGERDQEGNEDDEEEEEDLEGEEERKTTGGGAIEVVRWRSESRQAS